ncbi:MAG TPA: hypothetical protein VFC18_07540 [Burkholderiales bacterium]|nr:hypothetical protein [Burkholderiales bacterium]
MARDEHALDRRLALRDEPLEGAPALGDARRLRAQPSRLRESARKRAVGFRDRPLRLAQGVARLAALGFLVLELALQRLDAGSQRLELLLLSGGLRRCRGGEGEREEERPDQVFTFPWAETAAMRRSTSAGSPR